MSSASVEGQFIRLRDTKEEPPGVGVECSLDGEFRAYIPVRPTLLSQLELVETQEALVVQDLLVTFLGFEGRYIRYSSRYDVDDVDMFVTGPDYKTAIHMDVSLKAVAKKLLTLSKYYSGLSGFIEIYDKVGYGRLVQRFCFEIQQYLKQYRALVQQLKWEFDNSSTFNIHVLENTMERQVAMKIQYLYGIAMELHQINQQKRLTPFDQIQFEHFVQEAKETLQGGSMSSSGRPLETAATLSIFTSCKGCIVLKAIQIQANSAKGDTNSFEFLSHLYSSVSEEYVVILNQWLLKGEIDDPFDEFLVKEQQVKRDLQGLFALESEEYWANAFVIRTEGLIDQFLNSLIQQKILNTGKYLNIFQKFTGLQLDQLGIDLPKVTPIEKLDSSDLEIKINQMYLRANVLMGQLIFQGYNLTSVLEHLGRLFFAIDSSRLDQFLGLTMSDLRVGVQRASVSRISHSYEEVFNVCPPFEFCGEDEQDRFEESIDITEIINQMVKFSISSQSFFEIVRDELNIESFDAERALANVESKTFGQFYHEILKHMENKDNETADLHSKDLEGVGSICNYTVSHLDISVTLPFPLNIIMGRQCLYRYELICKFQMIIKFMSKYSESTWKTMRTSRQWCEFTKLGSNKPAGGVYQSLRKWCLRATVLQSRMYQFLIQIQNYLAIDVIKENYSRLIERVESTREYLEKASHQQNVGGGRSSMAAPQTSAYSTLLSSTIQAGAFKGISAREVVTNSLDQLILEIDECMNDILYSSLVLESDLVIHIQKLLDIIGLFNHFIHQATKIMGITMDVLASRYNELEEQLNDYNEIFGTQLTAFMVQLNFFGQRVNKNALEFSESLERCFPSNQ